MASGQPNSAVVLGASMGGLLAARVLADFYQKVTVVERDLLPDVPLNRRGVPQGRHPHALLGKAVEIIGDLFPGIFDQLRSDGAIKWDDGDMSRFWSKFAGHLMVRSSIPDPASLTDYHLSRPLLEHAVRRAVRKIPNIEFLEEHDFVGLTADTDHARITGTRVQKRGGTDETVITADLVIDATGRGSRTPLFLEELGYPPTSGRRDRGTNRLRHRARAHSARNATRTRGDQLSHPVPPDDVCHVRVRERYVSGARRRRRRSSSAGRRCRIGRPRRHTCPFPRHRGAAVG